MGERWPWEPETEPEGDIQAFFLDNERRRWSFVYLKETATIGMTDFREVVVHGKTIDDPVHMLTAFSKARTLFRIGADDPASDWLWACFRATRDLRKNGARQWENPALISNRQPGVFRRKNGAKKGSKTRKV